MTADTRSASGPERVAAPDWQRWLQTAGLAAAVLAAGALLDGGDPFLLRRGFSWLALPPLLAGLQFGAVPGMACGAVQGLALAVAAEWLRAPAAGPWVEAALGWLLAGLVAGCFRDAWRRRLEAASGRLRGRLEVFAREYHVLRLSHDRLQRARSGRPAGLRDALEAVRRRPAGRAPGSVEALGGRILSLLCEQARIRAATLHRVDSDGRPGPAVAALGADADCAQDPLLRDAAQLGEVVVSAGSPPRGSGVVAAVPLADAAGSVMAVVAIREVPFAALREETLRLLAFLGGHLLDSAARPSPPAPAPRGSPARSFCLGVSRSLMDAGRHGIPSSLAVVRVKEGAEARSLALRIAGERRRTDEAVVLPSAPGGPLVVLLLRLADAGGLAGYRARLERLAGVLDARGAISVRGWPLAGEARPRNPEAIERSLLALGRIGGALPFERAGGSGRPLAAPRAGAGGAPRPGPEDLEDVGPRPTAAPGPGEWRSGPGSPSRGCRASA
ncbi:MAG TPA: PelD GGDEF domain-containing protein [Anaeromyxobacteraceae bacterium]